MSALEWNFLRQLSDDELRDTPTRNIEAWPPPEAISARGVGSRCGQHVTLEPDSLLALVRAVRAAQALRHEMRAIGGGMRVEGLLAAFDEALAPFAAPAAAAPANEPACTCSAMWTSDGVSFVTEHCPVHAPTAAPPPEATT